MTHLLVTNDFPPKIGGIQSYLYELWRRLPAEDVTVLTTPYAGAEDFDRRLGFRVERTSFPVLLPTPQLNRQIRQLAEDVGASLVVLDPALPLGLLGRRIGLPYAVVLHGAEVTVPGRIPLARSLLGSVIGPAELLIAAGGYPAEEARRVLGRRVPPIVVVPPGVDTERFHPLGENERRRARARFGLPLDAPVVVSVSRLVPRKGMDVLIKAAGLLRESIPELVVVIGGSGRDRARLDTLVKTEGLSGTVRMLGRVADDDLPALDGCADVWAMLCRDRWLGLEQEGFGIVFLEAAASGVVQVAGRSGGAHEAVEHDKTGLVVDEPSDPTAVAAALASVLEDPERRRRLGKAARKRVEEDFDYDVLAARLRSGIEQAGG